MFTQTSHLVLFNILVISQAASFIIFPDFMHREGNMESCNEIDEEMFRNAEREKDRSRWKPAPAFVKWLNGIILAPALFVSLCHYISSDLFCLSELICTFAASLFCKARWGFKRQPFLIVVHPGVSEPDRRVNTAWNQSHKPPSHA